jgi:hypothetical protein
VAEFEGRIGAAPVCAKSTRRVSRLVWWACGALAMSRNGDGENGLKDLDSALSFGAGIEEIAECFLGAKSRTLGDRPPDAIGRLRVDSETQKPQSTDARTA